MAQNNLGWMYKNGQGVPRDYTRAIKWYRKAAKQENASAQLNLGWMYDLGEGVSQDYAEAAKWYRLAAEQEIVTAQFNLALKYGKGEGVTQNHMNAYILFSLAAAQGNEDARKGRDISAEKLSAEQLAEAQRLSSEWEVGEPLPLQGD